MTIRSSRSLVPCQPNENETTACRSFRLSAWKGAAIFALILVLGLGQFSPSASAQVVTWNNTGGTTDFNTATNWAGNVLPDASSVATFDSVASVQPEVSADISVSGLNFSMATSNGYVLTGINGASLTLLSTATGATGAINAANTSGINQIAVPVILGAGTGTTQTITLAGGSGGLQLNSVISSTNNVGLSLSAGANINIFQVNTYTGPTTIAGAGSVVVTTIGNAGVNGNLGAGDTINLGLGSSGGSLLYGSNASNTSNRTVNLNGTGAGATLSNIGSGALIFSSDLTAPAPATKPSLSPATGQGPTPCKARSWTATASPPSRRPAPAIGIFLERVATPEPPSSLTASSGSAPSPTAAATAALARHPMPPRISCSFLAAR